MPSALVPIALTLAAVFGIMFVYAARSGQFVDPDDPPERMPRD
jgi:cbb3-type cytochrome oxidase maturation protein